MQIGSLYFLLMTCSQSARKKWIWLFSFSFLFLLYAYHSLFLFFQAFMAICLYKRILQKSNVGGSEGWWEREWKKRHWGMVETTLNCFCHKRVVLVSDHFFLFFETYGKDVEMRDAYTTKETQILAMLVILCVQVEH